MYEKSAMKEYLRNYRNKVTNELLYSIERYLNEYVKNNLNTIEKYFFNKHIDKVKRYIYKRLEMDGWDVSEYKEGGSGSKVFKL